MILNFDIQTTDQCKLIITDKTDYPDYSTTESFAHEDCAHFIIINYGTIKHVHFFDAKSIEVPIYKDGYFKVQVICVPKEKVAKSIINTTDPSLSKRSYFYVKGNSLYQVTLNGDVKSSIEIVEDLDKTNTYTWDKEYISICRLKQCYINICREILDNMCQFGKCNPDIKKDSDLIFRRDVAWMAINVIEYLVKNNKLVEAGRIIDQLSGCNGICQQTTLKTVSGCGCGK